MKRLALAAIAVALCAPSGAQAAVSDREFNRLRVQVQEQARHIRTLERITAEQNAKLNWFEQCTAPLDLSTFTGIGLVAHPQERTWAVGLHVSCIYGSVSGFPW